MQLREKNKLSNTHSRHCASFKKAFKNRHITAHASCRDIEKQLQIILLNMCDVIVLLVLVANNLLFDQEKGIDFEIEKNDQKSIKRI